MKKYCILKAFSLKNVNFFKLAIFLTSSVCAIGRTYNGSRKSFNQWLPVSRNLINCWEFTHVQLQSLIWMGGKLWAQWCRFWIGRDASPRLPNLENNVCSSAIYIASAISRTLGSRSSKKLCTLLDDSHKSCTFRTVLYVNNL